MAEEQTKKTKPPEKLVKDKPAKAADPKVTALAQPTTQISRVDQLEELSKIDLDTLGDLDTSELRKKMLQGIYLLEHVLFSQAGYEFKRIQKMRGLITDIEADIFQDQKFKNMSESEKLRLYRMLMGNMSQSLEFMSNFHKNVTLGIEAVNSIDRMKADKGLLVGAAEDTKAGDEVDNIRATILEKIAKKLKDTKVEVVRTKGENPEVKDKPKPKKKKKPKPKIQKPASNVPVSSEVKK